MTKTREEILAWQKALDEFRATPVGRAFYRYKNALTLAVAREAEDSFTDKDRASTKDAHQKAIEAEHELLALLNAPAELTGGMKPSDVQWCRHLFDSIKDGGVWGLPSFGLVFRKIGTELVLVDRMPYEAGMFPTENDLQKMQDDMYEKTRCHFEAAGINVRRKSDENN